MAEDRDSNLDISGLESMMQCRSWPHIKSLLVQIHQLRMQAFVQPTHWDHTPSESELLLEKDMIDKTNVFRR